MGFSDKPVTYEYTVTDHADMHEVLMARLKVDSCHVLAHDLGDSVGQELLARYEAGDNAYGAPSSSRSPGSTAACSTRPTGLGFCKS